MNETKDVTNEHIIETTMKDLEKLDLSDTKSLEDLKSRIPKDVIIDIQDFELANRNQHPRDAYMLFNEKFHKYWLFDPAQQRYIPSMMSITSIVGSKHEHFDADAVIAKCKPSWDSNPKSEYHNKTPEDIKNQWLGENKAGTYLHRQIELYYNNVLDDYPEFGDRACRQHTDFKYFLNFDEKVMKARGYRPHRTEWRIYCPISRVCGTIDCVVIPDPSRPNEVIIFDWKRTKKLRPFELGQMAEAFKYMKPPIKNVPDDKMCHYMLQLHLYKILLERHYGLRVLKMHLAVFHPDNKDYVIHDIDESFAYFAKLLIKERENLFKNEPETKKIELFFSSN